MSAIKDDVCYTNLYSIKEKMRMNVNYPKLRTVPETTYFFLSAMCTSDFCWVLENIYQTTNYKRYKHKQLPDVIPPEIEIPTVKCIPLPGANRISKETCVIVSHFNTDDLHEILHHICIHTFDKLNEYHEELNNRAMEEYLQNI